MHSTVKTVVMGDKDVGKTSLCTAFTTNFGSFPLEADKSRAGFEKYAVQYTLSDDITVVLALWDTTGEGENYDRLRPLIYPQTDVFLMCFSIVNRDSHENIRRQWFPEVMHHIPNARIILVGTKMDLRDDPEVVRDLYNRGLEPISYAEADALRRDINAYKYFECSALTRQGLSTLFEEAMRVVVYEGPPKPRLKVANRHCCIIA